MRIKYIFRRKKSGYHSVEKLYHSVGNEIKKKSLVQFIQAPFESRGLFRRIANILYFSKTDSKEILHVTGDINYIAINRSKNIVLTILDCVMMEHLSGIKKFLYLVFWLWLPVYFSKIVIVLSEKIKKDLIEKANINENKIKVIPVPVSEIMVKSPKTFNKARPAILMVGTAWNKNLDRCIEALEDLNCVAVFIGNLSLEQISKLKQKKISYTNFVDIAEEEVYMKYVEADILLFPSLYEGFGMPIIEANSVGRPVVTSNISPMSDIADCSACFVDPMSVQEIRNGLLKVINEDDYRIRLINNGYENAKKYNITKIQSMYLDVYTEILSK